MDISSLLGRRPLLDEELLVISYENALIFIVTAAIIGGYIGHWIDVRKGD